jgi:hypothetical protein
VLHIPLDELSRGGAQDLLAHDRGFGMDECHDVLQLVAEAIGADQPAQTYSSVNKSSRSASKVG